jgi:hypothetical protein
MHSLRTLVWRFGSLRIQEDKGKEQSLDPADGSTRD